MPAPEPDVPAWLNLLAKAWPILLVLVGLIGRAIDRRFKKMVQDAVEASEEKWRRELQAPIGDVGIDAMKALDKVDKLEPRIHDLEQKMAPVWRMIERRIDDSLRQGETDKHK